MVFKEPWVPRLCLYSAGIRPWPGGDRLNLFLQDSCLTTGLGPVVQEGLFTVRAREKECAFATLLLLDAGGGREQCQKVWATPRVVSWAKPRISTTEGQGGMFWAKPDMPSSHLGGSVCLLRSVYSKSCLILLPLFWYGMRNATA